jgi:hypothetical protein
MEILEQFARQQKKYPLVFREVEAFIQGSGHDFSLCMKYLYGHMPTQDVLSVDLEVAADYVSAALQALEKLDYAKSVPQEIFFPYVLYHRVNSEEADGSRGFLQEQLLPYTQGKTMEKAALAVNYWCYAQATYTPADDRTLGPLAVLRRTLGRCGEESVLAVAALRSVGIPARQCYCPRWSHCDDNHAWVEVWIDGQWHYLGACEPEPVLDRGWFTAAASRAMLVDTKCWAGETLFEKVNCTSRYAPTRLLTVQVLENGSPCAKARVRFQVVNYSESFTLWETQTDENGLAQFETGLGSLLVFARKGDMVALEAVDLRHWEQLTLELKNGFPQSLSADLVPPEDVSGVVPYLEPQEHLQLLEDCEAYLTEKRSIFEENSDYLHPAAGNAGEIRAFLEESPYPQSHKEQLLSTLRIKDFADTTRETLEDALESTSFAREQYPEDIFRGYILAPRIADEKLLPERKKIRALFPKGFADPEQILLWMKEKMQILPEEGVSNFYPSAYGCLRCRQVPSFAFDMVFVAVSRAFGFPARLEPSTGHAQWLQGRWRSIHPEKEPVSLTMGLPEGKKLNYYEHLTLGYWNGEDFITLAYPGMILEESCTFRVQPGLYRITVTTRQIDGTASVAIWHLELKENATLQLTLPEDQTSKRLKQIPLHLSYGALRKALQEAAGHNVLLIFADPGSEPTEHLLVEMEALAGEFASLDCRILVAVDNLRAWKHPRLRALAEAISSVQVLCLEDRSALSYLHRKMQVGDLRLPFVVCMDQQGRGVYANANYQIRLAQTLLEIQKLLAQGDAQENQDLHG